MDFHHLSPLKYWSDSANHAAAILTQQGCISWNELSNQVAKVRLQLKRQGFHQSDVLLVVTQHSSFDALLVYLASLEEGVICAFAPLLACADLQQRFSLLEARACYVCSSVDESKRDKIEDALPQFRFVDQLDDAESKPVLNSPIYDGQNLTSLIFTSGSTGYPKAVAHSISNHLASAEGLQNEFHFGHDSCWLLSLPIYHVSGLAIVWRWLLTGCRLKLKQSKALELDGVTHTAMVPTQLKQVLELDSAGTVQRVLLGGAIIPHTLASLAQSKGIDTWAGYGLTEMGSTVTAKRVDETDSAGFVLPSRLVKVDEKNHIWVGGATLAKGYWDKGQVKPLQTVDGWFDTQDLGHWQGEQLVIDGRADNLFISGGENIHCEEVERVLLSHSLVTQAFIVPIADETYGHRPVAVIASPAELTPSNIASLQAHCQRHLQKFKCPIEYYLLPDSLLNNGIKVSRKALSNWLIDYR